MEIKTIDHYVCAGECRSESEKPALCVIKSCSHYGKPMVSCTCADGRHREVWERELPSPIAEGF